MKKTFPFILLFLFFFGSLNGILLAEDLTSVACRTCHIETIERDFSKQYLHLPFTEEKCIVCHIGEDDSLQNDSHTAGHHTPLVNWIGIYSSPDVTHGLKLSRIEPGRSLLIEADLPKLPSYKMQVTVPQFTSLSTAGNDGKSPVLTEITVDEVKRSVLISAVISWKTDELANSTIRYGLGVLDKSFHDYGHFSKNHEIILNGLQANSNYTYEIISADIFGNETISNPYTFSTKRYFSAALDPAVREPAEVFITHNFLKINDDTIMLELSANTPVTISIGYYSVSRLPASNSTGKAEKAPQPDDHVRLSGKEWSCITSCYDCHEKVVGPMSHPVNVRPPADMVIPSEYPTMADGRITCMSCHDSHGSNLEYRLLKSSKRELCVGCHRDMV